LLSNFALSHYFMKIKQRYHQLLQTRYGSAILLLSIFILFSTVTRLVLTLISLPKLDYNIFNIIIAFGIGFFYDFIAGLFFIALLMLYLWLCPSKLFKQKWHKFILYAYCVTSIVIMVFNIAGEIIFWDEYGNRYDFIAVDYLIYTYEVINNIIESYPVFWILGGVFIIAAAIFYFFKKYIYIPSKDTRFLKRTGIFLVYISVGFLSYLFLTNKFRFFSKNSYTNELAANGLYEFGTAYFSNEINFYKKYTTINDSTAFLKIRELLKTPEASFLNNNIYTTARTIMPDSAALNCNVVMISVESLSGNFMKYFGDTQGMTPVLDSLIPHALFFSNMYATGTRTVRGLEALSLAIPPTPGQSIVRRPNNEDMFTLGNVLNSKGYECKYIYGGRAFFDNMGPYFGANGYKVIDQTDFTKDEIQFTTAWGACDEDIFAKALKECDKSFATKKLFYNHVMTVSNHKPFTFPKGRVKNFNPDAQTREGAVAYSDWAIGQFLKEAQQKPWFKNTIFIIVSDHCASAAGKVELPVTGYQIPAMIFAPNLVKPQNMNRLMSQIDLIPTVLGLMNVSYTSKFFGYNMFKLEAGRERAFISTYQKLGYIKDGKLVILGPKKTGDVYVPDFKTGLAVKTAPDSILINEAITWYQTASYMFTNRLYGK
jgi:phosphoglycerol transferase MdoB-like AlkP superfamily enzyme